jgi:apolipoprotein N-acyltransferase
MDKMKKIERWYWLKFNKKQPGLFDIYAYKIGYWLLSFMFLMLGMLLAISLINATVVNNMLGMIVIAVLLFVASICYAYIQIKEDKRDGYAEMMKNHAIERWHKKRKQYGIED